MQPRNWHGAPHSTSWTLLKSVRVVMETRDRVAEATLHLSVAVQAGTAGRYRWPVALDYGDPMRRRLQLRAMRVFSASDREMMERRHDDDIAIGAEFRDLAGR
ncbi:hypothetical protein BMW22_20390 [Rhizobium leguminosarum]|uniref:Uncharacterized protein n=1 Tax=Rhizobium leguminosarum TaxID=384 RepID=A0A1L3ZDB4_RHILE|nr:hypothetical protein BMW22_20390 [Rhizobium leguminosarum]